MVSEKSPSRYSEMKGARKNSPIAGTTRLNPEFDIGSDVYAVEWAGATFRVQRANLGGVIGLSLLTPEPVAREIPHFC